MVFKIVKSGRKVRSLHRSLRSELELKKYMAEREGKVDKHPLSEDVGILKKEVDWLRFSRESSLYLKGLAAQREKEEQPAEIPVKEPSLLMPSIEDVLLDSEKWSGESVIIEGELEFYSRNKLGEHWHIFSDRSGMVTAVSGKELENGPGTLFGIARQTKAGKQVFLEIKNFHPSM